MGHQPNYECTRCGATPGRDNLLSMKVSFVTLGANGRTVKSRTPHWLCFPCLNKDEFWNMEEYDSPGLRNVEKGDS